MKKILPMLFLCGSVIPAMAQDATVTLHPEEARQVIPREIYGQFAEHLGTCIYGGLWVGKDSQIPNTDGYRTDVLEALKELKVPVLRWPGGCFADEYHWTDGIGPQEQRPKMQNNNWGGTIEDNSFGTHEFLNLCELLGAEPYVSGNVGSGSVEEMAKWVEYMTSDGDTPMANLRRKNGRAKSWNLKYFGVGNESWGCGGNMRPEYYSDLYRRYATYCRNYDGHRLFKVASGASDYDYRWTEVLMDRIGDGMDGISLHYYTTKRWDGPRGSATAFSPEEYYLTLGKSLQIEDVIKRHCEIMDRKDPEKHVALMLDEWGTWWDEEPGTVSGHLYQQNTMRDAMVAALTLNIFHKYTDRIKMANIAQVVNVLQSMILTDTEGTGHMVLTPTYHVFKMYAPFQNATCIPLEIQTATRDVEGGKMAQMHDGSVPFVSATAAITSAGTTIIALANTSLTDTQQVNIALGNTKAQTVSGEILTAGHVSDFNDFQHPERVTRKTFNGANLKRNALCTTLPPMSIVTLEVQ